MVITRKQYQDEIKEFWSKKCDRLQAEKEQLREALGRVCSRCSHLESVQQALKGEGKIKSITEHPDVQRLIVQIELLSANEKRLKGLLEIARCPNTSCQDGAIPTGQDPDGNWEACQCQWCFEKEQALKGE